MRCLLADVDAIIVLSLINVRMKKNNDFIEKNLGNACRIKK